MDGLGDVDVARQISGLRLWAQYGSVEIMALGGVLAFLLARFEDFLSEDLYFRRMRKENPSVRE